MKRKSHNAYGASNELKFHVNSTVILFSILVSFVTSGLVSLALYLFNR